MAKKPKTVMVISVKPLGGKAPKKPTKTSAVDKGGMCGVKKSKNARCADCGKEMNFPPTGRRDTCQRCDLANQYGEDSPEVADLEKSKACPKCGKQVEKGMCKMGC